MALSVCSIRMHSLSCLSSMSFDVWLIRRLCQVKTLKMWYVIRCNTNMFVIVTV